MLRFPFGLVVTALLGAAGCGPQGGPASGAGSAQAAIIGGAADATHQAIVALVIRSGDGTSSLCSGTIVGVQDTVGSVLTAAHCVLSRTAGVASPTAADISVVQGNDSHASDAVYAASAVQIHPFYEVSDPSSPYDFAIVFFPGAGPNTPVIPPLSDAEDRLRSGDELPLLGFGQTSADPASSNSLRGVIHLPIGALTPLTFSYAQAAGGTCHGDSGGPALVVVGGEERVGGVTSDASELSVGACNGTGRSGRVSTVYADWLAPAALGASPSSVRSCPQLNQGASQRSIFCATPLLACHRDADCSALVDCLGACALGDASCAPGCRAMHKPGEQVYLGYGQADAAAPAAAAPGCSIADRCPGLPRGRGPVIGLLSLGVLARWRAARGERGVRRNLTVR